MNSTEWTETAKRTVCVCVSGMLVAAVYSWELIYLTFQLLTTMFTFNFIAWNTKCTIWFLEYSSLLCLEDVVSFALQCTKTRIKNETGIGMKMPIKWRVKSVIHHVIVSIHFVWCGVHWLADSLNETRCICRLTHQFNSTAGSLSLCMYDCAIGTWRGQSRLFLFFSTSTSPFIWRPAMTFFNQSDVMAAAVMEAWTETNGCCSITNVKSD